MVETRINWNRIVLAVLVALFTFFFINVVWTSDDAMSTYRSVTRFMHGGGLCWNSGERLQVFTHPPWFFCLCPVPGKAVIWWAYLLSYASTLAALGFLLRIRNSHSLFYWALLFTLLFSEAFLKYSRSGLENPLSYALFGAFIWLFAKGRFDGWFFGVAALIFLNRMDYALILLLPCLAGLWKRRSFLPVLPGLALVFAWLLFLTFYFSYPFPNTFLAKVTRGIPWLTRFEMDLVSAGLVLGGITVPLLRRSRYALFSIGILFYFAYFFLIGGDFMASRFFAVSTCLTIALLLLESAEASAADARGFTIGVLGLTALSIATFVFHYPQFNGRDCLFGDRTQYSTCSRFHFDITNERSFYYEDIRLVTRGPLFSAARLRTIGRVNFPSAKPRADLERIFSVDENSLESYAYCIIGYWWKKTYDANHPSY